MFVRDRLFIQSVWLLRGYFLKFKALKLVLPFFEKQKEKKSGISDKLTYPTPFIYFLWNSNGIMKSKIQ